jgi:hypothetical protein
VDDLAGLILRQLVPASLARERDEDGAEWDRRREGSASGSSKTTTETTKDDSNTEFARRALQVRETDVGLNLGEGLALSRRGDRGALNGVGKKEFSAIGLRIRPGLNVVEEGGAIIRHRIVAHADNVAREDIDVDDAAIAIGPFLRKSAVEEGHLQKGVRRPVGRHRGSVVIVQLLNIALGLIVNGPDDWSDLAKVPDGDAIDARGGIRGIP